MLRRSLITTLFPYTTLFRSCRFASGGFVQIDESPIELDAFGSLSVADIDGDNRNDLIAGSERGIAVYFGRRNDPYTDRKSTRLNSSHGYISYAVFCLKKKTT